VITFLARADVALSVAMTAASTILAIVLTPLLAAWLAGSRVDVPAGGLLLSTVQVVALPLLAAALLKRWAPGVVARILPMAPLAAVLTITLIVGSIIGGGRDAIVEAAPRLLAAVAALHAAGFALGYAFARLAGGGAQTSRTISIEVGMQNSGLGVVLARQNFGDPLVAIPSAISSLFHSLIGSLLAAAWRRQGDRARAAATGSATGAAGSPAAPGSSSPGARAARSSPSSRS
jgi:BASS family bile acid:Na+ symporter